MKSILLTSTALVAFAGAAAAEVSFSGDATLGYNDTVAPSSAGYTTYAEGSSVGVVGAVNTGDRAGFYWDANVAVSMTSALDNGLTAGVSVDFDVANNNLGQSLSTGNYVLSLTSDNANLYYGDTQHAAANVWQSTGDMDQDTFRTVDGEPVLRGELTMGGINAQLSTGVLADGTTDGTSVGLTGTFGAVSGVLSYQAANIHALDGNDNGMSTRDEIIGVRLGASLAGADIALGYVSNMTNNNASTGVSISYPVGPVTLAASYVDESAAGAAANWNVSAAYAAGAVAIEASTDESDSWALEGSYDMGNGMVVYAGTDDGGNDYYVAGAYDLGGGANVLVSYGVDGNNNNTDDEIGANAYQAGTTVEVGFTF